MSGGGGYYYLTYDSILFWSLQKDQSTSLPAKSAPAGARSLNALQLLFCCVHHVCSIDLILFDKVPCAILGGHCEVARLICKKQRVKAFDGAICDPGIDVCTSHA